MRRSVLIAVLLLFSFAFWGGRSLRESSESRYGETAREMIETGEWMVPQLHGHRHLTKPPLAYWAIAGGMKVFGVNAWGARLPLAFLFAGTTACVFLIATGMGFGRYEALGASIVFATSGFSSIASFVLTTDPFLTFLVAAGMAALWTYWKSRCQWCLLAFWLSFGVAFMAKGPPAWLHLIPVAAIFLRRGERPAPLRTWLGVPLMVGAGLWWFLWMIARDASLLEYFVKGEVVNRILTTEHERNNSPLEYAAILLLGPFPWVFLWKDAFLRVKSFLAARRARTAGPLPLWLVFCLIWLLVPLAIFVFAKSRMPLYMLPLFLPLSLLLGKLLGRSVERFVTGAAPRRRLVAATLCAWLGVLLFARATPDTIGSGKVFRDDARALAPAFGKDDEGRKVFWLMTGPYHGISFYLNRTVHDPGLDHVEDLETLDPAERFGSLYLIKTKLLKRLDSRAMPYTVLGASESVSLIRLDGEAPRS
ncbi:MAG: hypothetical protein PWP23_1380 [Candidatus Sumerlaeota bacterium]|nr:hypothetical protein [Candidatus Sumerlaeota bacterium]